MDKFKSSREEMVDLQLKSRDIKDERILKVMRTVKRELFVGKEDIKNSYDDGPLPIGYRQTISQPYIVAFMTEVIEPKKSDRVLEIGTGSGYQTAVLADLVKEVWTVELIEKLSVRAELLLATKLNYSNIHFITGDGKSGWKEEAPFDKIIVTAAAGKFPEELFDQLKEGGIAVAPVGDMLQYLYKFEKIDNGIKKTALFAVSFVPLI